MERAFTVPSRKLSSCAAGPGFVLTSPASKSRRDQPKLSRTRDNGRDGLVQQKRRDGTDSSEGNKPRDMQTESIGPAVRADFRRLYRWLAARKCSTGVCVHGGLYIAVRLPHLERERQRCGDSSNRTGDKTMPVRQQERRSRWDSMYMDGRLVSALPIHFSFSNASPCLHMHASAGHSLI